MWVPYLPTSLLLSELSAPYRDFFGRCLFGLGLSRPRAEFLHPTGFINKLMLAGVQRMASRTYLDRNFFYRRTHLSGMAAGASYLGFGIIFRVNIFFHIYLHYSVILASSPQGECVQNLIDLLYDPGWSQDDDARRTSSFITLLE